jgi:hypothetical protein
MRKEYVDTISQISHEWGKNMLTLYQIQIQIQNYFDGNSTLIYMIGVILVHVQIIIMYTIIRMKWHMIIQNVEYMIWFHTIII